MSIVSQNALIYHYDYTVTDIGHDRLRVDVLCDQEISIMIPANTADIYNTVRTALQEIIANNIAKDRAIPKEVPNKTKKTTTRVLVDLKDSVVYRSDDITAYRSFLRAVINDSIPDPDTAREVFSVAEEYAERYQSFIRQVIK